MEGPHPWPPGQPTSQGLNLLSSSPLDMSACKDPHRDNSKAECLSYHPFDSGLFLDQFIHPAPNLKNHDATEQPHSLKGSLVLFECYCLLMCEVRITSEDRGQSHAPWEGSAWQPGSSVLFCKAVTQRVEDRCFCGTDLFPERQAGCRKKN